MNIFISREVFFAEMNVTDGRVRRDRQPFTTYGDYPPRANCRISRKHKSTTSSTSWDAAYRILKRQESFLVLDCISYYSKHRVTNDNFRLIRVAPSRECFS